MRPSPRIASLLITVLLLAACANLPSPPVVTPLPQLAPATLPPPTAAPTIRPPTAAPVAAGPAAATNPILRPPAQNYNAALTTFTTAHFSGSGTCIACHAPMTDAAGADVTTASHWRSTMMANASKDPIWQAKVSSEVQRAPALREVIEKKCAKCHTPMAVTQTEVDAGKVVLFDGGFLSPEHPLHAAGMDGISCTVCHQIQPANLGTLESFSGGYQINTATAAPDRELFGPYPEPVAQMMQSVSGFKPVHGPHMQTSEHCATCHNLYTPYVDAAGEVQGEFPEQTPYTEWQHSDFAQRDTGCQGCHMPTANGKVVLSTIPPGLPAREPFWQHYFAGGNAFMLSIINDNAAEIGVTAEPGQMAFTYARIGEQLVSAATASVTGVTLEDGILRADIAITTRTGHKFPTSFPSRRAWLHVTVMDAAGAVVFESGQPQADGSIAGNDADANPAQIEPHYEVITAADQVQIYEPIMGDTDGNVTYTLLRGASYLKDNRLLPTGFDKETAASDIAVYGAARDDATFAAGGDTIAYEAPVDAAAGPFTVSVALLYQPLSYRFVQDLLTDETALTQRFGGYYERANKAPSVVAVATGRSQ